MQSGASKLITTNLEIIPTNKKHSLETKKEKPGKRQRPAQIGSPDISCPYYFQMPPTETNSTHEEIPNNFLPQDFNLDEILTLPSILLDTL